MADKTGEDEPMEGYIEELIECPFCGGFVPNEFECILCEEELVEMEIEGRSKMVCSNCGTEVGEAAEECPECDTTFSY
ncbi:MAG: hypothetical protein KGY76_01055 [Candidatus Thermoplasmatota archaeon]|nr:hypothetical protein [Candidatus Thermoplasmatota archaeon]